MTNTNAMLHNPFLKWMVSILLVLGCIVPFMPQTASADELFTDVDPSNSHYIGILEAYENGFINGYPDGTFKPNLKLTRGNVTKALGKLVLVKSGLTLEDFDFSSATPFNDVPPTYSDRELFEYSIIVKEAGIFTGSNNNLLPKNLMTRQQMAKVLVNAFDLKPVPGKQSKVTDNHLALSEFREYIDILSENDVTTVTNFRPGESATRGQFATFLTNANRATMVEIPVIPEPELKDPEEPEEPVLPPTPLFVEELLPIVGISIQLPTTVKVIYSDASEKEHAVTWNTDGINLFVAGKHSLIGKVENTNLVATLEVERQEIFIMPLPPPTLIMIPYDPAPEVKKANELISKLPQEVKDADNALDAFGKWAAAYNATTAAKKSFPEYDFSHWDTVLSAQSTAIQKRQQDINKAKAAATVAVNDLLAPTSIRTDDADALLLKPITNLQATLTSAKNLIVAYEELDRKANTSNLHASIAKQQTRINDLKTVAELDIKVGIRLQDAKGEFVKVYQNPPTFTDPNVKVTWSRWSERYPDPLPFDVKTYSDHWVIERRYAFVPSRLYDNIYVEVSKGDASVRKNFLVHVPKGNLVFANPSAHIEKGDRYLFKLK